MLGKLLKYEIAATARIFLPLYGLLLLLTAVNKVFLPLNKTYFNIPRTISMTVYIILMVSLFVMTLVVTIQRFYRTLLCDEGYLSFTLPVKAHSHVDAKLITTLLWSVLSVLVAGISIFILAASPETMQSLREAWDVFVQKFQQYGASAYMILLELALLCVVSFLSSILQIYASITVGNMAGKHKLLAGFGAYVGFGVVEQIIASLFMQGFGDRIKNYFQAFHYSADYFPAQPVEIAFLVLVFYSLVFAAAYYFFTNWILSRKLNLE